MWGAVRVGWWRVEAAVLRGWRARVVRVLRLGRGGRGAMVVADVGVMRPVMEGSRWWVKWVHLSRVFLRPRVEVK